MKFNDHKHRPSPQRTLYFVKFLNASKPFLRIPPLLIFITSFLPLVGCSKPPIRTEVEFLLEEGKLKQIATKQDSKNNLIFGGNVISTKVISVDGNAVTEEWHIRRDGRETTYNVRLTPVPGGGTHILATSP